MIYGSEKNKLQKNVFIRFQFCKTRTKIIPTFVLRKREEEREGVRDKEEERNGLPGSSVRQREGGHEGAFHPGGWQGPQRNPPRGQSSAQGETGG